MRFFSRLHVRDAQVDYVIASESQILAEAVLAIDYRYPTGACFTLSTASAEYFRAELAGRESVRCLPWLSLIISINCWRMKRIFRDRSRVSKSIRVKSYVVRCSIMPLPSS